MGYVRTAADLVAGNALFVAFAVLCGVWFFRLDGGLPAVIVFVAVSAVHAAHLEVEQRDEARLVRAVRDLEREGAGVDEHAEHGHA